MSRPWPTPTSIGAYFSVSAWNLGSKTSVFGFRGADFLILGFTLARFFLCVRAIPPVWHALRDGIELLHEPVPRRFTSNALKTS